MKRRILALMFALLLCLPAQAAGADRFVRSRSYTGQFSDLPAGSTFYSNVSALYEYGLSVGKGDGTFGLKDSLTVGQAVIFAGRIRSLYRIGDPERGPARYRAEGQLTAQPYLLYLQAEGVLDTALDARLTAVATRAEMAHILANVLPEKDLPSVHGDLVSKCHASGRFITDVTESTPYYQDILRLYRCGISIGSDASGSFLPGAPITRGAAAAMLTRIIDPALRVTPQWSLLSSHSAAGTTLASLVPPGRYIESPTTDAEWDQTIRSMLSAGSNTLRLKFPGLSTPEIYEVMQKALNTVKQYCEQSYNILSCTPASDGTLTLIFSANGADGRISEYREEALKAAIALHDRLWANGTITANMTETEKARAYYTWICSTCRYDDTAADGSLSHIPYNPLVKGVGVCDGFTGNLVLKTYEGVGLYFGKFLKTMFKRNILTMLASLLFKNDIKELKSRMDYREIGGAPILGLNKPVIKAHGSSDARAFETAMGQAIRFHESGAITKMAEMLAPDKK